MSVVKKQLELTEEAVRIINGHATRKSQGEWISKIIVEYHRLLNDDPTAEECGIFERIDRRLATIEKRTALLVADKVREEQ